MSDIAHCREHIAPRYSDWDFAFRGAEQKLAAPLLALLSLISRLNDIAHRASEKAIAEKQLQWWREQIDAQRNPLRESASVAHPTLKLLANALQDDAIYSRLQRLLELVTEDIEFGGFSQRAEMLRFFRTRGAITLELFAALSQSAIKPETAADLGYFMEYCQIIAQFATHAKIGVIYFAEDDLNHAGWSAQTISKRDAIQQEKTWALFFSQQTATACASLPTHLNALDPKLFVLKRFLRLRYKWLMHTEAHGYPLYRYQLALGSLQKRLICLQSDWF